LLGVCGGEGLATVVLAVFEDLSQASILFLCFNRGVFTFFRTLDETLGRGMGWSDSPTSREKER
jgi:hypothetical protein